MTTNRLLAGVARRDITPPKGTYLIGYGNRLLPNVGARDALSATALTLRQGKTTVTFVACDLLAIPDATYRQIQALSPHPVLICCSHTHAGPVTYAAANSPRAYTTFMRWLVRQIIEAVHTSAADLRPVTLTQGTATTEIAVNRRQRNADGTVSIGVNPDGAVDESVNVLQLWDDDAQLLISVVNIACHPTVLDPGNRLAAADWVGMIRALVEAETDAPILFLQGACADLNPRLNHQPADRWNIRFQVGQAAAASVLRAMERAKHVHADELRHNGAYVDLPLESEPSDVRQHDMRQFPLATITPLLDRFFPWEATAKRDGVPLRVDIVRLGDMTLTGMGAEVFNEIGTALKASGDIVMGVTNGCIGYLPTAAEHALGGYEVDVSPYFFRLPSRLHRDAEPIAIQAVRALQSL